MSTYRLLPNEAARRRRAETPSPLACEKCGAAVGEAHTDATRLGVPAAAAIALWPALREDIKRHERDCTGMPVRRPPRGGPAVRAAAGHALTNAERFAVNLRELRLAADLSKAELARRAGTSTHAITFLESGATGPRWDTLLALCTALGVDMKSFTRTPAATPPERKRRRA